MQIISAEFVTSAVESSQYPPDKLPEIAFVGRSNVGKSSLLNILTGQKGLAKVGQTPGKTRLINFFLINKAFHLVDLPGYGYARVSKEEKLRWAGIINSYLVGRNQLTAVCMLVDSRHTPTDDDRLMRNWIIDAGLALIVVATKVDKLGRSHLPNRLAALRDDLGLVPGDPLISFSTMTKEGRSELLQLISQIVC